MTLFVEAVATVCLVWVAAVVLVQTVGINSIFRYFSRPPPPSVSSNLGRNAPSITVIRPVKGLEPRLHDCIASTFRQKYPSDKISIRLCIENKADPAYPVLKQLVEDFPTIDAEILIEHEDPLLHGVHGQINNLGPNPKVRNISRAYREAKGDIIWIIDCNVWVSSGVLGRMVDKLMGYKPAGEPPAQPYKFMHQMPLVVDIVDYSQPVSLGAQESLSPRSKALGPQAETTTQRVLKNGGGRLDEMFMATTHVKFYGAINVVGVAPCIVGKSNMFRKSHLDQVTDPARNPILPKDDSRPPGVDYFSYNICEDHLIGDLLWRSDIQGYANHGIAWNDLVIQPMADMSLSAYAARRVRWLRARKFTVLAATMVEPGVESLLCCAYFSFAVTTLPWFRDTLGVPQTWSAMAVVWLLSVMTWMSVDWFTFCLLHTGCTVEVDQDTPDFARGSSHIGGLPRRKFTEWLVAWIGRETMALPIWTLAVLLGTTVNWRGRTFHVRVDTTVEELTEGAPGRMTRTPELEKARQSSKDRVD